MGDGAQIAPDWDLAVQAALDFEVDQRIHLVSDQNSDLDPLQDKSGPGR